MEAQTQQSEIPELSINLSGQSSAPPVQEISTVPVKSKFPVKKILLFIILLFIISVAGFWGYFSYYKQAYSDSKYGFSILDQRGWYSVPKKEGVYYSIGTSDSSRGDVISYFGVAPIIHTEIKPDINTIKDTCTEIAQENNTIFLEASTVAINDMQGSLCSSEGKATNVDKLYIIRQYYLFNDKGKYDYILSASYPKGNNIEEQKVDRIVNNFHAL